MKRSLLVQTLLDMATGSGGAKLEALIVDAAGTFDAGSGKGYNPVTVPSGSINVLGEKGVVSNNSVVVTPKAQVVGGWLNSGETSGSGVGVTASELVSGTLNVSSDGVQDVTNYQNISVPSAGHSASAHKGVVTDHSIIVTPRSTATQGFVQAGTVEGTGVEVSAAELVSGNLNISSNGVHNVTNYETVTVSTALTVTNIGFTGASSSPQIVTANELVGAKLVALQLSNSGSLNSGTLLYADPIQLIEGQDVRFYYWYLYGSSATQMTSGLMRLSNDTLTIQDGRLISNYTYRLVIIK